LINTCTRVVYGLISEELKSPNFGTAQENPNDANFRIWLLTGNYIGPAADRRLTSPLPARNAGIDYRAKPRSDIIGLLLVLLTAG